MNSVENGMIIIAIQFNSVVGTLQKSARQITRSEHVRDAHLKNYRTHSTGRQHVKNIKNASGRVQM